MTGKWAQEGLCPLPYSPLLDFGARGSASFLGGVTATSAQGLLLVLRSEIAPGLER